MKPEPLPACGPVSVEIDELVLFGFPQAHAVALASEIRAALLRLLTEQGPPRWWCQDGQQALAAPGASGRALAAPGSSNPQGSAALRVPHMQVSVHATDTPAAIAQTLVAQLWTPPEPASGGKP